MEGEYYPTKEKQDIRSWLWKRLRGFTAPWCKHEFDRLTSYCQHCGIAVESYYRYGRWAGLGQHYSGLRRRWACLRWRRCWVKLQAAPSDDLQCLKDIAWRRLARAAAAYDLYLRHVSLCDRCRADGITACGTGRLAFDAATEALRDLAGCAHG